MAAARDTNHVLVDKVFNADSASCLKLLQGLTVDVLVFRGKLVNFSEFLFSLVWV